MMQIKKMINRHLLITLGLGILSIFIWFRFIKERLPKDIPFNLSLVGFILIVEVCCIYAYVIYSLIKKDKSMNPWITKIILIIYKPLIELDITIKNLSIIKRYHKRFIIFIVYKLNYLIKETTLFYMIFAIFPRIVLISVLLFDIFYFHKLHYIYKVLLIGILLLLNRYILYSLKYAKEQFVTELEPLLYKLTTDYVPGIYDYDYIEDEDEDNDIPPTMSLSLKRFVEFQTYFLVNKNKIYDYIVIARNDYYIKYLGEPYEKLSKIQRNVVRKTVKQEINDIIQISIIIEFYNITNYKYIKIIIFSLYLICWSYILFVSYHSLPMDTFSIILNMQDIQEPFSQLDLTYDDNRNEIEY